MRTAWNISRLGALGALGFLASCGDPVPPAPQGASSIHFEEIMDSMLRCSPGRHWANAPHDSTSRVQFQRVSAAETGPKAVNGQDGNSVSCSVVPDGSKFKFQAQLKASASLDGMKIGPTNIALGVPTGIGPGDSSAVGYLHVTDHASVTTYSDMACTYSVSPQKQGDGLGVDKGRIWGSVVCNSLGDPRSPGSVCTGLGFFIFENCSQ